MVYAKPTADTMSYDKLSSVSYMISCLLYGPPPRDAGIPRHGATRRRPQGFWVTGGPLFGADRIRLRNSNQNDTPPMRIMLAYHVNSPVRTAARTLGRRASNSG